MDAALPDPSSRSEVTDRQRVIAGELALYDVHWAGLFEAGIALVHEANRPGSVYLLAHAGRELARAVVHRLADRSYASSASRGDRTELEEGEGAHDRRDVFRDHIAAALELDRRHPAVDAWFKVYSRLVGNAHINPSLDGRGPDHDDVAGAFNDMAELIYGRLAPYFNIQEELDGLLIVEDPTDEHVMRLRTLLERPAQRSYFFHRLAQLRWFPKLLNAGLLAPPAAAFIETPDGQRFWRPWPEGDFIVRMASALPEDVATYIRAVPPTAGNPVLWRALLTAAASLPAAVSRDLVPHLRKALNTGSLQAAGDLVLRLARVLVQGGEPKQARNLVRDLLVVVRDDSRSSFLIDRVHFPRISQDEVWLLQHELLPALEVSDRAGLLPWATFLLRDAVRAMLRSGPGEDTATNVGEGGSDWSADDESVEGRLQMSFWLPYQVDLLQVDEDNSDPITVLARLVARTAVATALEGTEGVRTALAALRRHEEVLFRRIELLVLSKAGPEYRDEIGEAVTRVVDDPRCLLMWRREVAIFLRGAWQHAPVEVRDRFSVQLRHPDREAIRKRLAADEGSEPSNDEIEEHVRWHWRSMLQLFGSRVPPALADIAHAVAYDASAPEADLLPNDDAGTMVEVSSGPASPKSDEELNALDPEAVLELLREWHPSGEEWGEPSIDGLAHSIARYVARDPMRAVPLVAAANTLSEPSYVRAILGGLAEAARERRPVPWAQALDLSARVAEFRDEDLTAERPPRSDRSWRHAKGNALDMIEIGVKADAIPEDLILEAWRVIDATLENPDTAEPPAKHAINPVHGARYVAGQLSVSRGTLAYGAVWAAVWLAISAARLAAARRVATETSSTVAQGESAESENPPPAVPTADERRTAAKPLFSRLHTWLATEQPWKPSMQVAVGETVRHLVWLDPVWVAGRRAALFANGHRSPEANPTWAAYLVRSPLSAAVFELLRPDYLEAAKQLPPDPIEHDRAREGDPDYRLATHVVWAALTGLARSVGPDALVETVLTRSSGADLTRLYGEIARTLRERARHRSHSSFAEEIARVAAFWEWRLECIEGMTPGPRRNGEAQGLGWFFTVDGISDDIALALLARTVRAASRMGHVVALWWPRLARLVTLYPAQVLDLALLIVERHVREAFFRVRIDDATVIVRIGLAHNVGRIRRSAERLAHLLGERGYQEMKPILREAGQSPDVRQS